MEAYLETEAVLKEVAEQTAACTRSIAALTKKRGSGSGNPQAEIMLLGRPRFHENEQGLPFVGAAANF